jgi:ABC-2 type transport system ATP-binding protein
MIQVDRLTKYYGRFKALDAISFHASQGEILGFLGPNGAGKTTTMRILTGYMPPSDGSASIAGFDVFEESLEVRKRVGYMPETVPLYQEMTVWGFVDYMAALHRVSNREKQVDEVLGQVDMLERADSLISSLSKGMRQRVGLAQALVHEPEVLILDEPTIGLDPRQVHEVRELIREIGQDRTVLLSTHILSEASQLASRVLIINKGKIVAEDDPEALSARLQGAEHLLVRVEGADQAKVVEALSELPSVAAVTTTGRGLELTARPEMDARPAVAAAVVNNGWALLELRSLDLSLEDIFLQLTSEEETYAQEEDGE